MGKLDDAERFEPETLAGWSGWLTDHHGSSSGVWLVTARGSTGRAAFPYQEAVVEALRFGWIDGVRRRLDDERSMLWFSPRRPGSGWARPNKRRIAQLEDEGRLEPAGRAAVERARASGAWELLDDVEDGVVPADLTAALERRPPAREHWEGFTRSRRRMMLVWVAEAKRSQTRARRVEAVADHASRGEPAR